jgi:hypothetical protein
MTKTLIVIGVIVLILLVVGTQYVGVRNNLVAKNEAVKASWSQVDIVLQRRADLIPNLVATVKGYAQQEVTVFGDIAKARSALLSAGNPTDKIAANQQLDGALGRLLLIVENYPQLKSNENFLRLQDELGLKIALPSNARDITIHCRTTTPTFSNSPLTFTRVGLDSNQITHILPRPRVRERFRR